MEVPIHSPPPGSPPKVAVIPKRRGLLRGFLGLRMVSAFEINEGRALHTFFEMDDGSCLAFLEVPSSPFKRQDSLDLHIALGFELPVPRAMQERLKAIIVGFGCNPASRLSAAAVGRHHRRRAEAKSRSRKP
jgi:hypothetical protein